MENKKSYLLSAITHDGSARIIFADTSEIVQKAIDIHGLSRTVAAALGRTLTATSIMGYMLKDSKSTITVQFKGDGPIGTVLCVGDAQGNVRGYADNPQIELPANDKGKIDVGGAIGKGILYVIKDMGLETPYIGQSQIVTGEVGDDITQYFADSEQTPSICALGVRVNRDGSCKSAGGFILQMLPFADESIIPILENNIQRISSVSALISDGFTGEEIIQKVLEGIEFDLFDPISISYVCTCSREKYRNAIKNLSHDDLQKLVEDGKPIEACCHFCGAKYTFSPTEFLS
jgi:molecular chaperone Hsp33